MEMRTHLGEFNNRGFVHHRVTIDQGNVPRKERCEAASRGNRFIRVVVSANPLQCAFGSRETNIDSHSTHSQPEEEPHVSSSQYRRRCSVLLGASAGVLRFDRALQMPPMFRSSCRCIAWRIRLTNGSTFPSSVPTPRRCRRAISCSPSPAKTPARWSLPFRPRQSPSKGRMPARPSTCISTAGSFARGEIRRGGVRRQGDNCDD